MSQLTRSTISRSASLRALCVLWSLALLTAAAPARPEGGEVFKRSESYLLRVDDAPAPDAAFYVNERGDAMLIHTTQLPAPVVLSLRTREIATLAGELPAAQGDEGVLELPADLGRTVEGQFTIVDEVPAFTLGEHKVRIELPAPLLGLQPVAALEAHSPAYKQRAAAYTPDPAAMAKLAARKEPARVRVYFGSWCGTCQRVLPNLLKVASGLEGSALTFEHYGLPRQQGGDPEAERVGLRSLPTAIVYQGDTELGRITGEQWMHPEVALSEVLGGGR